MFYIYLQKQIVDDILEDCLVDYIILFNITNCSQNMFVFGINISYNETQDLCSNTSCMRDEFDIISIDNIDVTMTDSPCNTSTDPSTSSTPSTPSTSSTPSTPSTNIPSSSSRSNIERDLIIVAGSSAGGGLVIVVLCVLCMLFLKYKYKASKVKKKW